MGSSMIVKAPGVVKLFGEHAIVYGKLSVAAAISIYAKTEIAETESKTLKILILPDNITAEVDGAYLEKLYSLRKSVPLDQYIQEKAIHKYALPWATIAARLLVEKKANVLGKSTIISSEIPSGSGLASSAAVAASFAVALAKSSGVKISDAELIDIAREGDRIIHKNEGAGAIDASTSYYGGYVSFNKERGAIKEQIETDLNLLIVDTGPKKSTAETVGHVAAQYKEDKARIDGIMAQIERCSTDGLAALKRKDLKQVGKLMYEDQDLLASLGVSSAGLDRMVEISRKNMLLGAKLSGGGGGGVAIAAVEKKDPKIAKLFEAAGFKASLSEISMKGAKDYL